LGQGTLIGDQRKLDTRRVRSHRLWKHILSNRHWLQTGAPSRLRIRDKESNGKDYCNGRSGEKDRGTADSYVPISFSSSQMEHLCHKHD